MIKSNIQWNAKQISKMVAQGSLVFDNAIQRNFIWDKKRSSLLIDSMLRNYPIPPFYTIKDGRTVTTPKGEVAIFDCLDGKQRCTTINLFKTNNLRLTGLDPIDLEDGNTCDLNGKTYDELPEELQDAFDSYSLTVYYFTDFEDYEIKEMMTRLNNGKALSNVDITRINAVDLDNIKAVATHRLFDNFTASQITGHHNEDVVVKTCMLRDGNCGLDNKDVKPYFESLVLDAPTVDRLNSIFDLMADGIDLIKEYGEPEVAKKVKTKVHLVSLTTIADEILGDKSVEDKVQEFTEFCVDFFDGCPSKSDKYNESVTNGSNHKQNVAIRHDELVKYYNKRK